MGSSVLVINEAWPKIGTHSVLEKCESESSHPMNPIFDFAQVPSLAMKEGK